MPIVWFTPLKLSFWVLGDGGFRAGVDLEAVYLSSAVLDSNEFGCAHRWLGMNTIIDQCRGQGVCGRSCHEKWAAAAACVAAQLPPTLHPLQVMPPLAVLNTKTYLSASPTPASFGSFSDKGSEEVPHYVAAHTRY